MRDYPRKLAHPLRNHHFYQNHTPYRLMTRPWYIEQCIAPWLYLHQPRCLLCQWVLGRAHLWMYILDPIGQNSSKHYAYQIAFTLEPNPNTEPSVVKSMVWPLPAQTSAICLSAMVIVVSNYIVHKKIHNHILVQECCDWLLCHHQVAKTGYLQNWTRYYPMTRQPSEKDQQQPW